MTITLEFFAEQQNRILAELGTVRDDLTVNSAITRRIDSTVGHIDAILAAILDELRALHAQHARFDHRLRQMEPPL